MGYRKYVRIVGMILTAALFAATAACKGKPQTVDVSDIEEFAEQQATDSKTSDSTAADNSSEDNSTTDKKQTDEEKYPGLVVVHTNETSYMGGGSSSSEPQTDGDIKSADVVIYADGREFHYEHISMQYAPLDENYKYDIYDTSDMIVDIMTKAGYEEPFCKIRGLDPDEPKFFDGKTWTEISGVLNPQDADKTSIVISIYEYETLEEANEEFETIADNNNSYNKIDFSYNPEENCRTMSNIFVKQSNNSMSLQAFAGQKGNIIFTIYTYFLPAPRFNSDSEEPKPVYDLDTVEEILTAMDMPYSIFYED